ncbi:hypothetical protein E2C01_096172 [Portunus trituberculatus]|uniref:Uncharacterized protein n=1 Tax=Portunus trituberculatus TaxID=210409 RepID=A0A5B7JRZ6_PORTR|nr:hypothetical protein [Portunus trituberculatus]
MSHLHSNSRAPVVVTCGQEVSFLEFDFENPEYPEQIANDSSHCQLTVSHDCEVPICQVRLVVPTQCVLITDLDIIGRFLRHYFGQDEGEGERKHGAGIELSD